MFITLLTGALLPLDVYEYLNNSIWNYTARHSHIIQCIISLPITTIANSNTLMFPDTIKLSTHRIMKGSFPLLARLSGLITKARNLFHDRIVALLRRGWQWATFTLFHSWIIWSYMSHSNCIQINQLTRLTYVPTLIDRILIAQASGRQTFAHYTGNAAGFFSFV